MAGLPQFLISTQTDPYWEIPFYDTDGKPLSVEGRVFEAWIAPATSKTGVGQPAEPIKVLRFGDGLSLVPPTDGITDQSVKNTFVHQVSREFAQANFPRGELTADILEVVGSARRLLVPVRLRYDDPAAIRDFVADRAGVIFGGGRQPVVTPVAVAGQAGRRGAGFLTGTLPPKPSDGEDGDYWVVERQGQANLVYGPKVEGEWPAQPSSTLGVGSVADVPGLPAALEAKASVKYVPIYDADHQVQAGVTHVGVQTLTHEITIYFPDVDTFPMGVDFVASDESGFCSEVLRINLAPGPGTQDQIEDGLAIALTSRRQSLRFRRTYTSNLWVLS